MKEQVVSWWLSLSIIEATGVVLAAALIYLAVEAFWDGRL